MDDPQPAPRGFAAMDPVALNLAARQGGLARAAQGMHSFAALGRETFRRSFVEQVMAADPDLTDQVEIYQRATRLHHAFMLKIAAKSAAARRARAQQETLP